MNRGHANRNRITRLSIVPLVLALGCAPATNDESPEPAAGTVASSISSAAPTMDELANSTFVGILEEPVQLTDGAWQGEPFVEGGASAPAVGLVKHFHLAGDLTGDGNEEAIVLLWTSSGGSGTFDYLAVCGRTEDGIVNMGNAEIGDRVQIRAGRILGDRIELDVVQAGPEDAACCPTQLATRTWQTGPQGWGEIAPEITGTLSLAVLRGPEWVLTDFAWNEPAPEEPEVTVVFEEDRIAGMAGCNGYFGGIEEAGDMPSGISVGHLGSTRKMCPEEVMNIENRFFRQLAAATSYSFMAGRLAVSWQDEESAGVMIFRPRESQSADS